MRSETIWPFQPKTQCFRVKTQVDYRDREIRREPNVRFGWKADIRAVAFALGGKGHRGYEYERGTCGLVRIDIELNAQQNSAALGAGRTLPRPSRRGRFCYEWGPTVGQS